MTDDTELFFTGLGQRDDLPLRKATGTVRFELARNDEVEHWVVVLDKGSIRASRSDLAIDCECVVRTDKALFDGIARGEANATTAMLRGALSVEGEIDLLYLFQRLFAAPPTNAPSKEASARQ